MERIKVESKNNCLAKFVIVDLDRYKNIPGEEAKFKELIEYCKLQNKNGTVPHFLIIDNPDFEYVACLHISEYKGQNVKNYIESVLGFGTVEKFKAKKDIYQYLNSNKNSYSVMLKRIKENDKFIQNVFSVHKNRMEIVISKTNIEWDNLNARGSNIDEFFSILEW